MAGIFLPAHLLCSPLGFSSTAGTSLSFLFSRPCFLLCLYLALRWETSFPVCVRESERQQTREDADTSSCLQLPQPCELFLLNAAGKETIGSAVGFKECSYGGGVKMEMTASGWCWCWPGYVSDAVATLFLPCVDLTPIIYVYVCVLMFVLLLWRGWSAVCTCAFLLPCLLLHVCLSSCACCMSLSIHVRVCVCALDLAFPTSPAAVTSSSVQCLIFLVT